MNWTLVNNSLIVASCSALLALAFGFVVALRVMGASPAWRKGMIVLAGVTLALPPFLVVNCWLHLLGLTGAWRGWLPFNIYSPGGTVWILALMLWPISFFLVLGAWQRLEPEQLEADTALTGWPLIRRLLLPLARPALDQACFLTFVLAMNNFAVPALLQVKVYPAEVWVSFNTNFDHVAALTLSWPMIVAPVLLLIWFRHRQVDWPRVAGPVSAGLFRQQLGRGWHRVCGSGAILLLVAAAGLPLSDLTLDGQTWREWPAAVNAGRGAIWNSLFFAVVSATLVVMAGLASCRWRAGAVAWLPFLLPGVLVGIVLIFLFNRPGLDMVYRTAGIVFLAWLVRYFAVGWSGATRAIHSVDPDLTDAARIDGAAGWQLFRHVHWPQIAPLVAAIWYVVYLLCLWDVETLVLIQPPGGETVAARVFGFLHYGHNAQVNALCLVLLGLAALPLVLWQLRRWSRAAWTAIRHRAVVIVTAIVLTGCAPPASNDAAIDSRLFDRVQIIGSRGAGLGQFNKPRSVTVDARDNLYVVDMTGRVQKFSPGGEFLSYWQMEQTDKGKPKGMCRDGKGNIVVIEPHYSRVNHFAPDGRRVAQWGVHGTNAGQLAFPRAAAVNSRGDIYVCEYQLVDRVQRFGPQGEGFLGAFGRLGTGPGEFSRPEGLGVDRHDQLFVADSCNHRIQIFSSEGRFLRAHGRAGEGPGELSYPYDVQVDAAGRQYVCEFGNSRIQIFDDHDRVLEILGGAGAAPGQFNNPWSLALDSRGNLYVADSMNHRVQKFIRKASAARNPKPETRNPKSSARIRRPDQAFDRPSPVTCRPSASAQSPIANRQS